MYFLEQCGRKRALFLVFRNLPLSERFRAYMSTRSSTSIRASETSKPVISRILNFSARFRALSPILRCIFFSVATLASSLKNDLDMCDRSKLNPYGMSLMFSF